MGHILLQSLALGSVQAAVGTLVNGLIVVTAGSLAAFLAARPLWVRVQWYATGTVLGAFAITMTTDRSKALVTA
jgi:threonine/homoserine/homoserine lactone efflux protein